MSYSLALMIVVASFVCGCATQSSRQSLIEDIDSVIPPGWYTFDRGDGIWVIRKQPVRMTSFLSSLGGSAEPHSKTYQIVLSNADFIPPSEFHVVRKKQEEVDDLRKQVMVIPHEKDKTRHPRDWKFQPRTKAEENMILEYRNKSQRIKPLPNLYWRHHAFRMDQGFLMDSFEVESDEKECIAVLKSVLSLFNEYGDQSNWDRE